MGHNRHEGGTPAQAPTEDEHDALMAKHGPTSSIKVREAVHG